MDDDPDYLLKLLTYEGEEAAADVVAEMLDNRYLELPHSLDEPFSDETREAMEAMVMERNESTSETQRSESPQPIFDVESFEGTEVAQ